MHRFSLIVTLALAPHVVQAGDGTVNITADVVYGHKDGLAMTFDVFAPKDNANGVGVLFMFSGGWYSSWIAPEKDQSRFADLTAAGFTVFSVRHGSSPRFGIPDAVADVRRAVRYIRLHASDYGIDPDRIGVYGMSAGGHLSLMLGTGADEGKADDEDPVLRVSDRVQAVVAFVAPTDLTIMVHSAPEHLPAYDRFPALTLDMDGAQAHSPLKLVTKDDAPTLLIAGAKDDLVPVAHSRRIHDALKEAEVTVKLVEYPEGGHGFNKEDTQAAMAEMVAWFEQQLSAR